MKASDISSYKGFFIPYVYSVDNPVHENIIAELIVQNRLFNKELGERLRRDAAVTVNATIEENAQDKLTNFEMTIEEYRVKDRDTQLAPEGIRVTRSKERGAPQEPPKTPLDFGLARSKLRKPIF
ncbi:MAG TPA: hypothetical protein VNZ45_10350 [Bacteroidia bacterium]|nr:hypothetical protein [Bacteroidia bacterium]